MEIDDKLCAFCSGTLVKANQKNFVVTYECENKDKKCSYKITVKLKEEKERNPLFMPQFNLKNGFKQMF